MENVTLLLAIVASALVFFLKPVRGLMVYIASFSWYPTYLTLSVGTVDFTVRRLVILAIFMKLFLATDLLRRFKIIWLDKIVLIYFASQLISGSITAVSVMTFIENRAGDFLDSMLPYFAIRLIIRNKQMYLILLKSTLFIAIPLSLIGIYQCLTGHNPVGFFKQYYAWDSLLGLHIDPWERSGFFRADVIFAHPIMYGLYFAMFGTICLGLMKNITKQKNLCKFLLILMLFGALSSVSSGPLLALIFAIFFILFYSYRKYWKPVAVVMFIMFISIEIISNRHFYEPFSDFAFSGRNAWYRSRLIDVALFEGGMSGHWLTGFGANVDPGWGPNLDGRAHTDMVNQYLLVLTSYGLLGLFPFLAMNIAAAKQLISSFKKSLLEGDKWLIWSLAASLFGLAGAFFSVSIFGPPVTIYYMSIGLCGVMPLVTQNKELV